MPGDSSDTTAAQVIVVGSVNTDLVIAAPRLPRPGETVLGGSFFQAAGGKGANQAVAAARLATAPVLFVAAIGDDEFGQSSLAGFQRENLDLRYLNVLTGQPSGIALIMVDEQGENIIGVASGANSHLESRHITAIDGACFQNARTFLTCLETPLETVVAGLKRARSSGLTTILNPAPASQQLFSRDVLQYVDILTPNAGEIELMSGQAVQTEAEALRIGRQIEDFGCETLIITRGSAGAWVISGGQLVEVEAHHVMAVDTTAAGDAFNGALATAIAEGRELMEACRWASVAAAISVTRAGAQSSLATRDELNAVL